MRQPLLCLLLVGLLVPTATAHEEEKHDDVVEADEQKDPELVAPVNGYTGPSSEPYLSFFEGAWLYGRASAIPLVGQEPRHMRAWGDWIVWEDAARGDIYAHNVPAGSGFYVTTDRALQRSPEIHDDVVVWEDYRNGRSNVYAYFLETAETRRVSSGSGNHRSPSIQGGLVAWEDDREGTLDVYAARLDDGNVFVIANGTDRQTDPLVVGDLVFYRTFRYNVWDVAAFDVARNESFEVTSDVGMNGAPFTNGDDAFFLSQYNSAWTLQRYDVRRDRVVETRLRFGESAPTPASGDHLLQMARDIGGRIQLVARNLSTGDSTHVTGSLSLATEPTLLGRTAYVAVVAKNGTSLLALEISPFAFGKRPTLTITSPGSLAPWARPIVIQGILETGPGWMEPATFTVRVADGPPQLITPSERWRVTLDPSGYAPGYHTVTVRATFREGPPLTTGLVLAVPAPTDSVDASQAGPAYHAQRAMAAFELYIGKNPGAYALLPLLLVLLVLVVVRLVVFLRRRLKRDRFAAEYVPPE